MNILNNEDKKIQLNIDILSALKPLKGLLVHLKTDNYLPKHEETNKNLIMTDDKLQTSSTLPKNQLSNEFILYDNISKQSFTTESILKPIPCYPNPNKFSQFIYQTQMNPFIHFPNITFNYPDHNDIYCNPAKIPFFHFKQNYPFYNPYKTLTNPEVEYGNDLLITFNDNNKNTQKSAENKKEFISINKNNNKKINAKKTDKLLNKKRIFKTHNQFIIDDVIKNNNNLINNNEKTRTKTYEFILEKKEPQKEDSKITPGKNMFSIYKKSKYVFKRRKQRIKQPLKTIEVKCGHEGCDGVFKTKKHLAFHHYKMSIECHNDTLSLLKLISSVKKIFLKVTENKSEKIIEKYYSLYKESMNNISLDEHIGAIAGYNLKD